MAEIIDFKNKNTEDTPPEPRTFIVKTLDGQTISVEGFAGIVPPVVMVGQNDGRIDCIVPISNLHSVIAKSVSE